MSPSARSKILAAQKDKLMHKHVQNKPMTSVLRQPLEGFYLPGAQDTGTFLQSHVVKDEIAFQNHRFTIGNAEVVETHRRHYSSLQAARNTLQTKAPEQNLVLPRGMLSKSVLLKGLSICHHRRFFTRKYIDLLHIAFWQRFEEGAKERYRTEVFH